MIQEPAENWENESMRHQRLSRWALTTFVLGILTMCLGPLGLIPIAVGFIATRDLRRNPSKYGYIFAVAGIVLGCIGLASTYLWYLGSEMGYSNSLMYGEIEVQKITQSLLNYAEQHGDQFPSRESWSDELMDAGLIESYHPEYNWFDHDDDGVIYTYLPDRETGNSNQILIYDDPDRWREGVLTGFADGRVEMIPHDEFEQMLAEQTADSP